MPTELALPRRFAPEQATAYFGRFGAVAEAAELRLVLPEGAVLAPTGQSLVAASIAQRRARGLATQLTGELERLASEWAPILDFRTARQHAQAGGDGLERELPQLASSVTRMLRFLFEELGVNIVQHSERPATGFGFLRTAERRLELSLADRGVGFLASLQRNPELEGRIGDEAEALQLALGKGLTGSSSPRRNLGLGLGLLQDFSDRIDGELWLASGSALLRRRSVAGVRSTTVHACPSWNGSWVCLSAAIAAGGAAGGT